MIWSFSIVILIWKRWKRVETLSVRVSQFIHRSRILRSTELPRRFRLTNSIFLEYKPNGLFDLLQDISVQFTHWSRVIHGSVELTQLRPKYTLLKHQLSLYLFIFQNLSKNWLYNQVELSFIQIYEAVYWYFRNHFPINRHCSPLFTFPSIFDDHPSIPFKSFHSLLTNAKQFNCIRHLGPPKTKLLENIFLRLLPFLYSTWETISLAVSPIVRTEKTTITDGTCETIESPIVASIWKRHYGKVFLFGVCLVARLRLHAFRCAHIKILREAKKKKMRERGRKREEEHTS